jgi:hypothetical protein
MTKKVYVFPVGSVEFELLSREDFDEIVKKGKAKGHTHCHFTCVGSPDRIESFDSAVFKVISNNLDGYNVCAVRTGFPFYSNCNRFRYEPYVSGVTERENNSLTKGFVSFMNS